MASNAFPNTLYVLGTARDSGKTVASMGLIARLLSPPHGFLPTEIGYLKPVAQHVVRITTETGGCVEAERDAALVTQLMAVGHLESDAVGPVIWRRGATVECIDDCCASDPQKVRRALLNRIVSCYERVAKGRHAVILEGTGQMGVGSVGGVSSADIIARLLDLGVPLRVLLVVRGESVDAIDCLFPHVFALRHLELPLDGVIVNRIPPDRFEQVKSLVQTYYRRVFGCLYGDRLGCHPAIRILGYVPEILDLALPSLRFVVEQFEQQPESGLQILPGPVRENWSSRLVRRVMVLSLTAGYERLLQEGDLVVVGANAETRITGALGYHRHALCDGKNGLSGVFLSCRDVSRIPTRLRDLISASGLPVFSVQYDSARVLESIHRMQVKIQPYETAKRDLITRIYCDYVDSLPGFPRL